MGLSLNLLYNHKYRETKLPKKLVALADCIRTYSQEDTDWRVVNRLGTGFSADRTSRRRPGGRAKCLRLAALSCAEIFSDTVC